MFIKDFQTVFWQVHLSYSSTTSKMICAE